MMLLRRTCGLISLFTVCNLRIRLNDILNQDYNMLYLSEKTDNWNEGLNPELTSGMHLIYSFHNLYEHTCFSIFDLLWVRDFNVEISVEYDYATYKE